MRLAFRIHGEGCASIKPYAAQADRTRDLLEHHTTKKHHELCGRPIRAQGSLHNAASFRSIPRSDRNAGVALLRHFHFEGSGERCKVLRHCCAWVGKLKWGGSCKPCCFHPSIVSSRASCTGSMVQRVLRLLCGWAGCNVRRHNRYCRTRLTMVPADKPRDDSWWMRKTRATIVTPSQDEGWASFDGCAVSR